jgi:hypothetical protein
MHTLSHLLEMLPLIEISVKLAAIMGYQALLLKLPGSAKDWQEDWQVLKGQQLSKLQADLP